MEYTTYEIDIFGSPEEYIDSLRNEMYKKGKEENKDYFIKVITDIEKEEATQMMLGGGSQYKTDNTFPFSVVEGAMNRVWDMTSSMFNEKPQIGNKKELYNKLKEKTEMKLIQGKLQPTNTKSSMWSRFFTPLEESPKIDENAANLKIDEYVKSLLDKKDTDANKDIETDIKENPPIEKVKSVSYPIDMNESTSNIVRVSVKVKGKTTVFCDRNMRELAKN